MEATFQNRRLARKTIDYFSGKSDVLINRLCGKEGHMLTAVDDPWLRRILEEDRAALVHFYQVGPARNTRLKEDSPLSRKRTIGQAQLDDMLVV